MRDQRSAACLSEVSNNTALESAVGSQIVAILHDLNGVAEPCAGTSALDEVNRVVTTQRAEAICFGRVGSSLRGLSQLRVAVEERKKCALERALRIPAAGPSAIITPFSQLANACVG